MKDNAALLETAEIKVAAVSPWVGRGQLRSSLYHPETEQLNFGGELSRLWPEILALQLD
jgi:hypothetical protein